MNGRGPARVVDGEKACPGNGPTGGAPARRGGARRRLLLAAVLAVAGCAGRAAPPRGRLAIVCPVPGALVVIDDTPLGGVAGWAPPGRWVRAGFHRVEVRHPEHHPHYAEVSLKAGEVQTVTAILRPILD